MIFINRNGLRRCDGEDANATGLEEHPNRAYGPHKPLYNRWKRGSERGVFARILVGLAAEEQEGKAAMIDATCLKTHRTAPSLRVKNGGVGA